MLTQAGAYLPVREKAAGGKKASCYRVQVLDRAFAILQLLAGNDPELGVSAISHQLDLHKSTLHRLLAVLQNHQLVEKNATSGKYRLRGELLRLGARAVARLDPYHINAQSLT